jgi:hypothetical protein
LTPDAARGVARARDHLLRGAEGGLPAQPGEGNQLNQMQALPQQLLGGSAPRPIGAPALRLAAVALPSLGALQS